MMLLQKPNLPLGLLQRVPAIIFPLSIPWLHLSKSAVKVASIAFDFVDERMMAA